MDDVTIIGGWISTIVPNSDEARDWLKRNLFEEAVHWADGSVPCENDYLDDIVDAMRAEGFTVGV